MFSSKYIHSRTMLCLVILVVIQYQTNPVYSNRIVKGRRNPTIDPPYHLDTNRFRFYHNYNQNPEKQTTIHESETLLFEIPQDPNLNVREYDADHCHEKTELFHTDAKTGSAKGLHISPVYTPHIHCPGNGWCTFSSILPIPWTSVMPMMGWPSIYTEVQQQQQHTKEIKIELKQATNALRKQFQETLHGSERAANTLGMQRAHVAKLGIHIVDHLRSNHARQIAFSALEWRRAALDTISEVMSVFFETSSFQPAVSVRFFRAPLNQTNFLVQVDGVTADIDMLEYSFIQQQQNRSCNIWPFYAVSSEDDSVQHFTHTLHNTRTNTQYSDHNNEMMRGLQTNAVRIGPTLFSGTLYPEHDSILVVDQNTTLQSEIESSLMSQLISITSQMDTVLGLSGMHRCDLVAIDITLEGNHLFTTLDAFWSDLFRDCDPNHRPTRSVVGGGIFPHYNSGSGDGAHDIWIALEFIAYRDPLDRPSQYYTPRNNEYYGLLTQRNLYAHSIQTTDGTVFISAMSDVFEWESTHTTFNDNENDDVGAANHRNNDTQYDNIVSVCEDNQRHHSSCRDYRAKFIDDLPHKVPSHLQNQETSHDAVFYALNQRKLHFPGTESINSFLQTLTQSERCVGRWGLDRKDFFWAYTWMRSVEDDYEQGLLHGWSRFYNTSGIQHLPAHSDSGGFQLSLPGSRFQSRVFAFTPSPRHTKSIASSGSKKKTQQATSSLEWHHLSSLIKHIVERTLYHIDAQNQNKTHNISDTTTTT